jgi:hypothetical protein
MEAGRRDGDLWAFRGRNNSANVFVVRAMSEDFSTPKFAPNAQNGGVAQLRGFILQSSYRVVSRPNGQRIPVIHLYGRLESGETFLVRDDRQRPHFFIRAADAERARALRIPPPKVSGKRTFDGASVVLLEVETPPEVPGVRDRLHNAHIDTFEADVRFAVRYRARHQGWL